MTMEWQHLYRMKMIKVKPVGHLTGLDKTAIDFHFRNWFHSKNTYTHTVIVCLIHDAHTYGYIIYVVVGRYALKMP